MNPGSDKKKYFYFIYFVGAYTFSRVVGKGGYGWTRTRTLGMHNLDFAMKTTQMESVLLSSPSYELKNVGLG